MSDSYKMWLAGLKVGDKVAVEKFVPLKFQIKTIERISKKQEITVSGEWNKYINGVYGQFSKILPITQNIIDKIEYDKLLYEFRFVSIEYRDFSLMTLDQLTMIKEMLPDKFNQR